MDKKLNYLHLHHFWSVAKAQSLTEASKQLHVSQSALSSQIRQLESQLEQKLFFREGRSLKLTENGKITLRYAERIFGLGTEMINTLKYNDTDRVQSIRIGSMSTLSRNFQEKFLLPILGRPEIKLTLRSGSLDQLLTELERHQLDLILSNKPVATETRLPFNCQQISKQKVCLVGPDSKFLNSLTLPKDLARVKTLVPGNDSDIRTQLNMYCAQNGIDINIYAEVDDMATLRLLAQDIEAVTIVPEVVVQNEIQSGVLKKYCTLDSIQERFFAITAKRQIEHSALQVLLVELITQAKHFKR